MRFTLSSFAIRCSIVCFLFAGSAHFVLADDLFENSDLKLIQPISTESRASTSTDCIHDACCVADLLTESFATKLTGDWNGRRSDLDENGITFEGNLVQFYQGVTSGGRERRFRYAGNGEYLLDVDFSKLGIQEGLTLRMRAEHRLGKSIDDESGALLPPSVLSNLPATETEDLVLSEVLFTQFLSENVAISVGKINTLVHDMTPFTGGHGEDSFMNTSILYPSITFTSVPLSTLGASITIFKDKFPLLNFTVLNSKDTVTQSGFDQLFEDGVSLFGTVSIPTPLSEKPGVQTFGFSWTNKEQIRLGQDPRFILPQRKLQGIDRAWSLFWSGFQYIKTYDDPTKGWGIFGSAGFSDKNPSFLGYSLVFGIGGDCPFCSRPNDKFGIAWFYNGLSDELGPVSRLFINPQDESGEELFYNFEVTPSFHLTPDLEIINPGLTHGDTAILFALRGKIDF